MPHCLSISTTTHNKMFDRFWLDKVMLRHSFKVNNAYRHQRGILHFKEYSFSQLPSFFLFFQRSSFIGSAWSFVFFPSPPQRLMTSDFEGFSIPDFINCIYFPILIFEKEPVFSLLECSVLNKGTTGTIFITSLV